MKNDDIYFMSIALKEAKKAFSKGEVPVGSVIVKDKKIISKSFNLVEKKKSQIYHAEILSILKAQKKLNDWRLNGCTIYVTVEPCLMCISAIKLSRISKLVFGCRDKKFGGVFSLVDIEKIKTNHKIEIVEGILEEESKALLKEFFKKVRKNGEVVELV